MDWERTPDVEVGAGDGEDGDVGGAAPEIEHQDRRPRRHAGKKPNCWAIVPIGNLFVGESTLQKKYVIGGRLSAPAIGKEIQVL